MPGGARYHQAPSPGAPASWAELRISPHDGANGSPRPMNDSVVSVRTAPAKTRTVLATMRSVTFGRTCRNIIWRELEPMTRARSTNARSLSDSVCERMIRAVDDQLVSPMTMTMTNRVIRMPRISPSVPNRLVMIGARIERQDERRDDQEEVGDAHQGGVRPTAPEPGDDPDQHADEDRHDGRQQPDDHRDPGAVHGQVEDAPAELVGAQRVARLWRLQPRPGRRASPSGAVPRGPTGRAPGS